MEARFDANDVMLRPSRRDDCVRRRAAEMALPAVKEWLSGYAAGDDDAALIKQIMRNVDGVDGYQIAKAFDEEEWESDAQLVKILDQGYIYDAERELVRQWVKCLGVVLALPIGTKVRWRSFEGEIVSRDEALGQYGVHTSDMRGNAQYICNAEEVRAVSGTLV